MTMRDLVALFLITAGLAGCVGPGGEPASFEPTDLLDGPTRVDLFATAAGLPVPVPEAWRGLDVRLAPTGFSGGEPTIGVASDGTIFTSGPGAQMLRSRDHGLTWHVIEDPVKAPKRSLDPWIWLDPATDRVYNAPLYVVCTWAAWTDDLGETWDFNPATGCGVPLHDHQKLTTGPPAPGTAMQGSYPNVVYYAYNSFREEGTWVSVSYDGGKTYNVGTVAHPVTPVLNCHGGVNGPVAVGPDGTAYLPHAECTGVEVAVSEDSGQTWDVRGRINERGVMEDLANDPDISVDRDGNAYMIYNGGDLGAYLTVGRDKGRTWSEPVRINPPEVRATTFSVAASGEPGRVAFGYLGTASDPDSWPETNPSLAPDDAVWHLYMSFTENALDPEPTFVTVQVTPDDDPAQVGCIWLRGGANDCRNLTDFIDLVQRDGRAYLVYTDGCNRCTTKAESQERHVTVAIVEEAPSLLEGTLTGLLAPRG